MIVPAWLLERTDFDSDTKLLVSLMMSLSRRSGLASMNFRTYAWRLGLQVHDRLGGVGDDAKVAKRREQALERRLRRMMRLLERNGLIVAEIRQPGRGRARAYRVMPTVPRLATPGGFRAVDIREPRADKGGHSVPHLPGLDALEGGHQCPFKADTSVRKGGHQCPAVVNITGVLPTEGGEDGPPPALRAAPRKTATTGDGRPASQSAPALKASADRPANRLAMLAQEIVGRQTRPESVDVVLAILAEDLRLRRYNWQDVSDFLAGLPKIDAHAYRFRDVVAGVAASVRSERFVERLRDIRDRRLFAARRTGPDKNRIEATVDFISVDLNSPAIHLREFIQGSRGPFPGERITLTSLNQLAAWTFGPEQGKLFVLGEPPAKAPDSAKAADLARIPDAAKPGDSDGPQVRP